MLVPADAESAAPIALKATLAASNPLSQNQITGAIPAVRNDLIDLDHADAARVFDYLSGGHDNFAADRDRAEQLIRLRPPPRAVVREGREFAGRVMSGGS